MSYRSVFHPALFKGQVIIVTGAAVVWVGAQRTNWHRLAHKS